MSRLGRGLCWATCTLLALGLTAGPAHGQGSLQRTMTGTPDHGPPGTLISIDGKGCTHNGHATEGVFVRLAARAASTGRPFDSSTTVTPDPDGSWHAELTVPADAPYGDYAIQASCFEDDMSMPIYEELPFRVVDPAATTTSAPATTTIVPPTTSGRPTTTTTVRRTTTTVTAPTTTIITAPPTPTTTTTTVPASSTTARSEMSSSNPSDLDAATNNPGSDGQSTLPWLAIVAVVIAAAISLLAITRFRARR